MARRGREVVEVMRRRKIDVLCIQEVRWRGKGLKNLEMDMIYYVGEQSGRNGVGVIVSCGLVDSVVEVEV